MVLDMNRVLRRISRAFMLCLPAGTLAWLVREALIASKEPIIANINIRTFDGCGLGSRKIKLLSCVQSSAGDAGDPARNDRMVRVGVGRNLGSLGRPHLTEVQKFMLSKG